MLDAAVVCLSGELALAMPANGAAGIRKASIRELAVFHFWSASGIIDLSGIPWGILLQRSISSQ